MVVLEDIRPPIFAQSTWIAKATLGGLAVALAMFVSVAFANGRAHAQAYCDVRTKVLALLDAGYGEQRIATGLASTGNVVEVLISSDGTWTILLTKPDGIACVVAVGEEWQVLKTQLSGKSS